MRYSHSKKIGASFLALSYLAITLIFPVSAVAQRSVAVSTEVKESFKYVLFTFQQPDLASMEGCFYNLMASGSRFNLERKNISAKSIATFFKPLSEIKIIAGPLRRLSDRYGNSRTLRKKGRVYFRTLLTCYNGELTRAPIFFIDFETSRSGKISSINRLIKEMKFNMAYYDGD